MAKTVDFFFDVGSPAAYLAWTQLPHLCRQAGGQIDYKPFLLGGVFQATGNHSPATVPAKGKYMMEDLARFADRYGVPFHNNPYFPINTLMLMRAAVGVQSSEPLRFADYVDAAYRAIWVDQKNMNDPAVVGEVLAAAGFNPSAMLALTAEQAVKDKLKAITQEAVERGVFGAPTFFIDGTMYWGQDRLDFVREALAA
ncbi:MAG: 2-hydroxychromene-2-carboxylate isomerase [Polaromonas sp.]|uniref:2-hydroxychromene-2-carboxylate isomerase n=1 Tax=Polaromonas sp. TaxID=1869339 RepID=UPI002732943B|nr:2-hydroxychromene-2-carboxylate isomerase [Polaromonas sp.]MDP2817287.1 2-hydroxychromene-2-carboxylate isomerase [Polaromonas sp.]